MNVISKAKGLTETSIRILKNDGIGAFTKKTHEWFGEHVFHHPSLDAPTRFYMDVLFINGCTLPHPWRYRVAHQREQLLANGIASSEVFYEQLDLELIKHYRMFIFYRCPYTDTVGEFIRRAKEQNKTVLFDVDDLVIDRKYTDTIEFVAHMNQQDKALYDDGVIRMGKTLSLCDGAITTTERLAEELKQYVPEVYINRNVASERMAELSDAAVYARDIIPELSMDKAKTAEEKQLFVRAKEKAQKRKLENKIHIGYFSGSITHNEDINMILPALAKVMEENSNVILNFFGELNVPQELEPYKNRIESMPFVDWQKLPELISDVDINIAPLVDSIFNEAKSENKWTEASFVKVPTVASDLGAFSKMIEHNKTGLLCTTVDEWVDALNYLIQNPQERVRIGENAYQKVQKSCCTLFSGKPFADYIKSKMTPNVCFILPSTNISGGVLVALKHCIMLQDKGYDVLIFSDDSPEDTINYEGHCLYVISTRKCQIHGHIDKAVATLWTTVAFLINHAAIIKEKYYLVQNQETNFYTKGNFYRFQANQSYCMPVDMKYITISKWCVDWLNEDYQIDAQYARNGIQIERFPFTKRSFEQGKKVRILIEGNSDDYYKNVDESFKIVEKLDKSKYEIWFMSYQGKPKSWYHVDKFLHRVPNEEVAKVYSECDILLKTSILESFSYPPIEMMATGGLCVVVPNAGNVEYLVDEENCLFYPQGDIQAAIAQIERLVNDKKLQDKLAHNGRKVAESRDWEKLIPEILALYEQ
ncbi:MAG: glycosyltransferase [Lachnospiraceae bacterium]|nr:glycosyltransferase [Lachnospiraceae bacterium]